MDIASPEPAAQTNAPPTIAPPTFAPLTFAQRAVWLDVQRGAPASAYQLGVACDVQASIDPDLARQATVLLMARHEALRLRVDEAVPRQRIERAPPPPLAVLDLSAHPDADAACAAHIRDAVAAGWTLGDHALFRIDLIRRGPRAWSIVLLCHHLIGDAASVGIALGQWLAIYRGLAGEVVADLPPASVFLPLIEDDLAYEASAQFNEALTYWTRRLAEPPPLLFEAPGAATGAASPGAAAMPISWTMNTAARVALDAACARAGTTTQRAIVALLAITLGRRYGRTDVLVGMALHRRTASNRNVIGMLAGMLAARCEANPDASLLQAVRLAGQGMDQDLRHHRLPIDVLVRALNRRDALFDVAVSFSPGAWEGEAGEIDGLPVTCRSLRGTETSALALYVAERPGAASLDFELRCDPARVTPAEAARIGALLQAAITRFGERPTIPIDRLDALTDAERRLIEGKWRGTRADYPAGTLPQVIAAQAARTPDACAVTGDGVALSYAALWAQAATLAANLAAHGVSAGDVVGVLVPRTSRSVVVALAIMQAGAVYLPLDPAYPADRLRFMAADAGARCVLHTDDTPWPGREGIALSALAADLPGLHRDIPARAPAYIIYTSGSTGQPKGVAMSHAAAVNLAFARRGHDPIGVGDHVLAAISIGFDVSIGQLLLPLASGATVVVAPDLRTLSAEDFWAFLAAHNVTHINSVPSVFESVLHAAPPRTTLRRLMLGGERLSGALVARLRAALPGVPVVNMYGPTETCIDATAYVVPVDSSDDALPIGVPLPNYTAAIVDARLRPVGIGVPGELCIGGAGLAEGYVNRPELTADRFVPDPLGMPGERIYRTGDLACWREDGTIAFLGRADAQVKIRGFRVEPGEVEAALRAHEAVAQAAVVARDGRLLAYVVAAPGQRVDAAALRADLAARLPDHMVPAAIARLDALPLTRNGKLDARALPVIGTEGRTGGRPPATPTEIRLARIVSALLNVPDVSAEDDFFALGGHSLLAVRLISRIRAETGVAVPLRAVFTHAAIGALAAQIDATSVAEGAAGPQPPPRGPAAPLSHAQEGFWFLDRLGAGDAYNIPMPFLLEGPFDLAAADRALRRLVTRQAALRTVIVPERDGMPPTQRALPPEHFAPRMLDLTGQDEATLHAHLAELAAYRFDLTAEPPLLACFITLGALRRVLMAVVHHSAFDGWSAGLFFAEFATLYGAAVADRPDPLPPLVWDYADVAAWQRAQALDDSLAWWTARLRDAPPLLDIPNDLPRDAPGGAGGVHEITWPAALRTALIGRARESGASLFMLLHAAFALLLSRWSGQRDIVIGTAVANRTWPAWDDVIGCFVNTLALRLVIRPDESFATLLTRTREADLEALEHQQVPLDRVVEAVRPGRSLLHTPLVQVMLVLQNNAMPRSEFPGVTVTPLPVPAVGAKLDLTLNLTEQPDGSVAGTIEYAASLFRAATITRLAERLHRLLEAVAADPHVRAGSIDLLTPDEAVAIEAWRRGEVAAFPAGTLHDRIAAQAAATPDAVAVIGEREMLSYADLQARAGALAAHLAARGVKPGSVVGVLLPRSVNSVIAALGVLRAGCVYLPLDPAYPAARLAFMAADAGAACVLHADELAWAGDNGIPLGTLGAERAPVHVAVPDGSAAYVIYTSGSTGQPKGVAVAHAAAVNLAYARRASYDPIGPGDRILAAASVGFDVSIGQLLLPLLSGATVVIAPDLRSHAAEVFWDFAVRHGVTHLNVVPSVMESLLPAMPARTGLRRLMLGGERLAGTLVARIRARMPDVPLVNIYGPTETCIDATAYVVPDDCSDSTVPIGRPLPNYRVAILDADGRPTGIGVPGELFIGGAGVALGYAGQPELTASRFLSDPDGPPGARLYRTGDRAAWREDGAIAFLGRIDTQIKLRGFRIEPGEIEAALAADPGVAQAAVIARAGVLLAYVIAAAGRAIDPDALRERLRAGLPDHMVPAAVTVLPALPLTPNGKLDERSLPSPASQSATVARAPRDHHERLLQTVWQSVMNIGAIGVDDDFFALGGHSLLALRLITACGEAFGLSLPVRLLMEAPTIAAMATALRSGEAGRRATGPLRLRGGSTDGAIFIVHPVGGHAIGFASLAAHLPEGPAVFGLQAAGLEAGEVLAPDIGAMAAQYIAQVRAVQPAGPYRLIGASFGGVVAFEMARQLTAAGAAVDLLGLLDSTPPGVPAGELDEPALARAVCADYGWTTLADRHFPTLDALVDALEQAALLPDAAALAAARRMVAVLRNNVALNKAYAPGCWQGPAIHVRATGRAGDNLSRPGWSPLIMPAPAVIDIACEHDDLLHPDMAGRLAACVAPWLAG